MSHSLSASRGTLTVPGADLGRLPIGLDFRALSIVEGIRAAVAIDAIVVVNAWIAWPPLVIAALAALLTCLCDPYGPIGRRLPALLAFAGLGSVAWAVFGVLQPAGIAIVLPLAALCILAGSFARVWGQAAAQVGSFTTVVVIFALDRPLTVLQAAGTMGLFCAGGLWAVLLTLVFWRLHPNRPARRSIAQVWRLMADMTADLRHLLDRHESAEPGRLDDEWAAHARAHRRAIRDAIEQARIMVLATVRVRGQPGIRAAQSLIRLEAGDQIFGALIALSDLLEQSTDPARLHAGRRLIFLLRPCLVVVTLAIENDAIARPERLERIFLRAIEETASDPAVHLLAESMVERLRVAVKISTEAGTVADDPLPGEPLQRLRERIWGPVASNLTWQSDMLRHAVRAALVAAMALAITMVWPGPFQHWLPITAVLTMQPFFTATWQRVLERVAGTCLGALVGSFLAFFVHQPILLAALMVPLAVLAFAVRQVSYGVFVACLTPWVVVFVDVVEPGHSEWAIAGLRAFFTISGGAMALVASMVLWPTWESDRLRRAVANAIGAHASYADAALAPQSGDAAELLSRRARRAAGMASNNLEASLSRALHEPRHRNPIALEAALLADATLRRVAGRLSAIQHDQAEQAPLATPLGAGWRDWIGAALRALADQTAPPKTLAEPPPTEAMRRIVRQIELLDGALRRFRVS